MTPEQREAILAEVKGGNKIEAIKLCREATGMGLAEAKDWVERLETSPGASLLPAGDLAGALAPVADLLFQGEKDSSHQTLSRAGEARRRAGGS
ncbi:MAG: ribosomal protein L7/L12 [Limisphaerales bacterium]